MTCPVEVKRAPYYVPGTAPGVFRPVPHLDAVVDDKERLMIKITNMIRAADLCAAHHESGSLSMWSSNHPATRPPPAPFFRQGFV